MGQAENLINVKSGRSSFGRVIALQAIGSGFEARRPLNKKDLEKSGSFIFFLVWSGMENPRAEGECPIKRAPSRCAPEFYYTPFFLTNVRHHYVSLTNSTRSLSFRSLITKNFYSLPSVVPNEIF